MQQKIILTKKSKYIVGLVLSNFFIAKLSVKYIYLKKVVSIKREI